MSTIIKYILITAVLLAIQLLAIKKMKTKKLAIGKYLPKTWMLVSFIALKIIIKITAGIYLVNSMN